MGEYDGKIIHIRLPHLPCTPTIYLSDIEAASDETQLRLHHIDTVISLLESEDELPHYRGIEYLRFTIRDREGDIITIGRKVAAIMDAEPHKHFLIHCVAGISRSASIVVYYVMHKFHLSFEKARHLVKASRHIIHPHEHYAEQLLAAEGTI